MSTSYRSETEGLQLQLAQQRARIEQEIAGAAVLRRLYRRLVARSAAGIVGSFFGVAVFVCALLIDDNTNLLSFDTFDKGLPVEYIGLGSSTYLLVLAPLLSLVAYLLALGSSALHLSLNHRRPRPHGDDLQWELARLSEWSAPPVKRQAEKILFRSLAMPLIAVSLLGPLGLHLLVSMLLGGWHTSASFHEWIKFSVAVVTQCHITLAILSVLFVRELVAQTLDKKERTKRITKMIRATALSTFASPLIFVFGISAVGGGILAFFFVLVTGLFVVPPMICWAEARHQAEREILAAAL